MKRKWGTTPESARKLPIDPRIVLGKGAVCVTDYEGVLTDASPVDVNVIVYLYGEDSVLISTQVRKKAKPRTLLLKVD